MSDRGIDNNMEYVITVLIEVESQIEAHQYLDGIVFPAPPIDLTLDRVS